MRIMSIAALTLVFGCASTDFRRATSRDTEASYRAFIAANPDGEDASEARERLRSLAFQRAKRGDDIASYNRFLSEFPEGDFAAEAREKRALARLERAIENDDADALRDLLESDPRTRAASRANARLEEVEAASAMTEDEPARLRAFLLAFPDSDERPGIERRLDDLDFGRAESSRAIAALRQYLEDHPRGVHRAEAQDAIEAIEADGVIAEGTADGMERYLRQNPGSASYERVTKALTTVLLSRAAVLLDGHLARRVSQLAPGTEEARQAADLLESWERGGQRLAQERRLVADLVNPLEVRTEEELRRALESADPVDGWNAVREIALSPDPATLDLAVQAAGNGDPLLLFYARAALASRAQADGIRSADPLQHWHARLRGRSSNPEDLLRLGAVSEALGDVEAAQRAFRDAAGVPESAVAGAVQWALLASEHGTPAEQRAAVTALVEAGRARTEELLSLLPAVVDRDRLGPALTSLRGLESIHRVVETVVQRFSGVSSEHPASQPPPEMDELRRLSNALSAAARRLTARIQLVDADIRPAGEGDPLARGAAERRERRRDAARRLGELRSRRGVAALAEVVASDDGAVGREGLRALARISSPEARTSLLRLSSEDSVVRAHQRDLAQALRAAMRGARGDVREDLRSAAERLERQIPSSETPPSPEPESAPK